MVASNWYTYIHTYYYITNIDKWENQKEKTRRRKTTIYRVIFMKIQLYVWKTNISINKLPKQKKTEKGKEKEGTHKRTFHLGAILSLKCKKDTKKESRETVKERQREKRRKLEIVVKYFVTFCVDQSESGFKCATRICLNN